MAALATWLAAVALGSAAMWRYQLEPEKAATPAATWPDAASGVAAELASEGHTLVVSLHPKCPCSRATMAELARLEQRLSTSPLRVHLLYVVPDGEDPAFARGALWDAGERIPRAEQHVDTAGRMTQAFGAITSGEVALFDASGRRLFTGGITPDRGHEGDNVGARRIVELIEAGATDRSRSPSFGCALRGDEA